MRPVDVLSELELPELQPDVLLNGSDLLLRVLAHPVGQQPKVRGLEPPVRPGALVQSLLQLDEPQSELVRGAGMEHRVDPLAPPRGLRAPVALQQTPEPPLRPGEVDDRDVGVWVDVAQRELPEVLLAPRDPRGPLVLGDRQHLVRPPRLRPRGHLVEQGLPRMLVLVHVSVDLVVKVLHPDLLLEPSLERLGGLLLGLQRVSSRQTLALPLDGDWSARPRVDHRLLGP